VHSTRRRKQLILTYTLYESSDFWGLKIGDKLICMEKDDYFRMHEGIRDWLFK
jgi:hypothetical protein